jgi:hypothetical protein
MGYHLDVRYHGPVKVAAMNLKKMRTIAKSNGSATTSPSGTRNRVQSAFRNN